METGDDIFQGCVGLNDVGRKYHQTTVVTATADQLLNLGAHVGGRAECQRLLQTDATMQGDAISVLALDLGRVQVFRLQWIDHIESYIDQIRQQL